MLKRLKNLNQHYQTAIISISLGILLIAITSFLFFIGWMEIPLGFLIGLLIGALSYIALGIVDHQGNKKVTLYTILIISIRLVVLATFLFLVGYLYYFQNIRIFNIFSVVGGYLFTTITSIIVNLINKGK